MIESPENGKYQALVDTCFTLKKEFESSEYRAKKLIEIEDSIKRYEQDAPKVNRPWVKAYNIYLPLLAITIDNLEPRLVAGLVGKDPIVSFGTNLEGSALLLENWYNKELADVVKVNNVAMTFIHTLLKEGTYYCVPMYDFNEKEVIDFEFDQEGQVVIDDNGPVTRSNTETIFEGGVVNVLSFSDVLCADDLGTIEDWENGDKIIIVRPTYAELMMNKDNYMNIGPWLLSSKLKRKLKDKSPDQIVAGVDVTGKEAIECIECHISFPTANLKENPPEECDQTDFTEERIVATVAVASKTIIKFAYQRDLNMNNESLIKRGRLFPEAGRSFGTSMYGKMKAIQDGASDMFSQLMNVVTICMMPWYFYEKGAGVEGKQDIFPGAGVKVSDISKIKFAEYRINPRDYIEFINLWFQLWERIGGISDPQMGKTADQARTATEILTVVEEGNIKHNYQSLTFKEEFLQILRTLYDLYYQYMPYDKTTEVAGEEIPIPRALMRRPNNFRLTGSTDKANRLIERKENEDIFKMLRADPLVDPVKIIMDLIIGYNRDDAESYIKPEIGQLMAAIAADPNVLQVINGALQQYMTQVVQAGQEGQDGV